MFDVITFGSNVIDVFVNTDVHENKKLISYPIGAKILIKNLKFDIGGGGTNTAVAFSRLGLKTGYLGKIGKDENGNKVLNLLKKEKIKFLGKREGKTGYSIILDSKEHSRTILTYKGVNDNLKFNEIKKLKTKWLYYSSMLGDSFKTQIKLAKSLRVKLAFNPSEYLIKRYNLNAMLKLTNVLILNKEEAEILTKKKNLHELGPEIICITNKDKEIICYASNKKYKVKPHKIKVVERTGAGDAFASSFVTSLIKNLSIEKSLKLGLKNSESVIKHFGAKNRLLRIKL